MRMSLRDSVRPIAAASALILLIIGTIVGLRRDSSVAVPVVSSSPAEAVALELAFDGHRMRLEREHERWWVSEPEPRRPARSDRVAAAVAGLERAEVLRTVTREPAFEPNRYGLDAERRIEVEIEREDGSRVSVMLGSRTETGVYVGGGQFDGVRLADGRLRDLFPAEREFYIERRVFPGDLEPGRIRELTVESPGERYRLQYESFDSWRAREYVRNAEAERTEPSSAPDPSAGEVRAVLAALDRATGEEVRPRAELEINREPDARVAVRTDRGDRHELALYVVADEFWASGYGERSLEADYLVRVTANEVARLLRPLADLSRSASE